MTLLSGRIELLRKDGLRRFDASSSYCPQRRWAPHCTTTMTTGNGSMSFASKAKEYWFLLTKPAKLAKYLWTIDDVRHYQWHPVVRSTYKRLNAEFIAWCEANDPNQTN